MGRGVWPKSTVEQSLIISIYELNRFGIFDLGDSATWNCTWSNAFGEKTSSVDFQMMDNNEAIELSYIKTPRFGNGESEEFCYTVNLETTDCNYGGERYWFICPLSKDDQYCGRRVAKLYLAPGAKYFGCRHCYNLTYESRQEYRGPFFWAIRRPLEHFCNVKKKKGKRSRKELIRILHDLEKQQEALKIIDERDKRRSK